MDDVRTYLLETRRAWVETVLSCADAVAETWDGPSATEREQVVPRFRAALDRSGVLATAPAVLEGCVEHAGTQLRAQPVAAPPYVVTTSEGLLLRATFDEGRLLARIRGFELRRDPTRYCRREEAIEDAVVVERR